MLGTVVAPDGVTIHFETHGRGSPALVLVHGWCCDRTYWAKQIGPLSKRYQVVAIDLAGHGESGQARRAWTAPAFGADVAAVVEPLALEQVVLVGHSMGGPVVAEAARQLQGRVIGVVGADTYRDLGVTFTDAEITQIMAPFRQDFAGAARKYVPDMFIAASDPAQRDWIIQDMAAAPPAVGIGAREGSRRYHDTLKQTLRALRVPVVAINSDYRPNDVAAAKSCGVEIRLMSGTGHFVMMEDPGTFNRLLEAAVREFVGARAPA
ncbi:MAG: alpha/beta hydrolase [Dehalococcoidia bacterium]|nr:alpha/beta hydrolase [Dehalococcoidia bacterium]MSQ16908.1 alpha/beta hydrolase [Dehalococcoidia bacterium]